MFSFRTVLLLFLFALITIIGSTSGQEGCSSSPTQDQSLTPEELADENSQRSLDNADKFGRSTLDCETTGGGSDVGSGGNNGFKTIIELSFGLLFIIGIAIGIWFVFVRRPQALKAAVVKPYPEEMGNAMKPKTKTFPVTAPAGKLPNGDTNV